MGDKNSTPSDVVKSSISKAPNKYPLPTEIWFEILAFIKLYEAPNIFLVNRYLLPICQVYFHSGTIGQNKYRNVRELTMDMTEGLFTILVERNGTWQSVPVPEVDPPKIFKAFNHIKVEKCCRIEAMQFLNEFQSLLNSEINTIIFGRNFFVKTANAIAGENEKQINSNSPNSIVVDEKQFFLNLIWQKQLWLNLKDTPSEGVARCLVDVPLIAQFNGGLSIEFANEKNLC